MGGAQFWGLAGPQLIRGGTRGQFFQHLRRHRFTSEMEQDKAMVTIYRDYKIGFAESEYIIRSYTGTALWKNVACAVSQIM